MLGVAKSLSSPEPSLGHVGPSRPTRGYLSQQPAVHQQSNATHRESEEKIRENKEHTRRSSPCSGTRGLAAVADAKTDALQLSGIIGLQACLVSQGPGQEATVEADVAEFGSEVADFELASIGESRAVQRVLELVAADESNARQTDRTTARILAYWIGREDIDVLVLTRDRDLDKWVAPFIMYFLQTYPLTWEKCPSVGLHEYFGSVTAYYEDEQVDAASHKICWSLQEM